MKKILIILIIIVNSISMYSKTIIDYEFYDPQNVAFIKSDNNGEYIEINDELFGPFEVIDYILFTKNNHKLSWLGSIRVQNEWKVIENGKIIDLESNPDKGIISDWIWNTWNDSFFYYKNNDAYYCYLGEKVTVPYEKIQYIVDKSENSNLLLINENSSQLFLNGSQIEKDKNITEINIDVEKNPIITYKEQNKYFALYNKKKLGPFFSSPSIYSDTTGNYYIETINDGKSYYTLRNTTYGPYEHDLLGYSGLYPFFSDGVLRFMFVKSINGGLKDLYIFDNGIEKNIPDVLNGKSYCIKFTKDEYIFYNSQTLFDSNGNKIGVYPDYLVHNRSENELPYSSIFPISEDLIYFDYNQQNNTRRLMLDEKAIIENKFIYLPLDISSHEPRLFEKRFDYYIAGETNENLFLYSEGEVIGGPYNTINGFYIFEDRLAFFDKNNQYIFQLGKTQVDTSLIENYVKVRGLNNFIIYNIQYSFLDKYILFHSKEEDKILDYIYIFENDEVYEGKLCINETGSYFTYFDIDDLKYIVLEN